MIPVPGNSVLEKNSSGFRTHEYLIDLSLAGLWLAASTLGVYFNFLNISPLGALITIPLLFFIPGYSILAALFADRGTIGFTERFALSFGLSIALTAIIGLELRFTFGEINPNQMVIKLIFITAMMSLIALFRRAILQPEKRFGIPCSALAVTIHNGISSDRSGKAGLIVKAVLVLVTIIAIMTTVNVIMSPKEGEHFSAFFILGENRTADNYPDLIKPGLHYPMFVGIGNHEYRDMNYTIETWAVRSEFDLVTNNSVILAMDPIDRMSLILVHNETIIIPYNFSVQKTGYNQVEFLLFNETIPGLNMTARDRINASYGDLNLWITVL